MSHYSKPRVRRTIIDFCAGRWTAAWLVDGRVIRWLGGRPLKVNSEEDLDLLTSGRLGALARSLYSTAERYARLHEREDVFDPSNVVEATPFWDVDNDPERWRATVEAARAVVDALESLGIVRSVYVVWSGRGMHVRVHERAISEEVRQKAGTLDAAWALVEDVRLKIDGRVAELRSEFEAPRLRVDNEVKPRGLFSVPLSLHRSVDAVDVCLNPYELDDFDPSWSDPLGFRSTDSWRRFEPGEADQAVLRAIEVHGGYPGPRTRARRRKEPPVDEMIRKWLDEAP
ncbi:MAG: hypothetical protein QI223_07525 [Candidatus Korarchaeota archaeon]|nr:hypothetical protein [Candidatus Korarchaeota archaeon]